ncbi:prephenate/arogenate dehydrogenase family protein [Amorphus orientalis]|uniref:prephenate dehydrogenase n=1 Tax=Amorphus orientalis TaxID=649198 RepID=A0AAE3VRZ2_9HYPH|nr:prephenate/arogenate dehydrogenase family protein [Amorphus orientalis]MDQ0317092.1 cyclohexadieny/prephenate dehydrogenase [Amorphus orientalis]
MADPLFRRVAIIGIGLIGSSIARKVMKEGLAEEIAICDRGAAALAEARELGLGHVYEENPGDAVKGAGLVVSCVPVGAAGDVAVSIAPWLEPDALVTDTGSVKASVVRQMLPHLPDASRFVPAHPVAGTENSGPSAGFADLFENRWCILTPTRETDLRALDRVSEFWRRLGADVETMTPEHHDLVLAITSHLPHLIAYNIVGTADDLEEVTQSEVIKFSAGGFRDFTRLAASDPTMWRDVFLHNREAVLEALGRFSEDLAALQRAIRWSDGTTLFDTFTRTRAIRRGIIDAGQEIAEPDFGRRAATSKSADADGVDGDRGDAPERKQAGAHPSR